MMSFPRFSDGDVEIHFTEGGEKYVLHSYVLALHSTWFKASLSERWQTQGASERDASGKTHWIYELRFDKDGDLGLLVRKGTDTNAVFIQDGDDGDDSMVEDDDDDILHDRRRIIQAHRQMFSLIYHMPVIHNIEAFNFFDDLEQPLTILQQTAESYGCESVVGLHIRNALCLSCHREEILEMCIGDPVSMLEVAMKFKSDWVFQEAGAHLIGRSNRFFTQARKSLFDLNLTKLFDEKRRKFIADLKDVELRLFQLELTSNTTHTAIATAYFRKWLAEQRQENNGSNLGPGYASMFHKVSQGKLQTHKAGRHQQLETFWKLMTCSTNAPGADDFTKLDTALSDVLKKAKNVVFSILSMATLAKHHGAESHRALTYLAIEEEELPWKT